MPAQQLDESRPAPQAQPGGRADAEQGAEQDHDPGGRRSSRAQRRHALGTVDATRLDPDRRAGGDLAQPVLQRRQIGRAPAGRA